MEDCWCDFKSSNWKELTRMTDFERNYLLHFTWPLFLQRVFLHLLLHSPYYLTPFSPCLSNYLFIHLSLTFLFHNINQSHSFQLSLTLPQTLSRSQVTPEERQSKLPSLSPSVSISKHPTVSLSHCFPMHKVGAQSHTRLPPHRLIWRGFRDRGRSL